MRAGESRHTKRIFPKLLLEGCEVCDIGPFFGLLPLRALRADYGVEKRWKRKFLPVIEDAEALTVVLILFEGAEGVAGEGFGGVGAPRSSGCSTVDGA
jgi:hypothetical protein